MKIGNLYICAAHTEQDMAETLEAAKRVMKACFV